VAHLLGVLSLVVVVMVVTLLWVVTITLPILLRVRTVLAGILVPLVVLRAVVLSTLVCGTVVGVASTVGVTVIGGTCIQLQTHTCYTCRYESQESHASHSLGNGEQPADVQREPPLMKMKTSPKISESTI
jgi:hypothetical protein